MFIAIKLGRFIRFISNGPIAFDYIIATLARANFNDPFRIARGPQYWHFVSRDRGVSGLGVHQGLHNVRYIDTYLI